MNSVFPLPPPLQPEGERGGGRGKTIWVQELRRCRGTEGKEAQHKEAVKPNSREFLNRASGIDPKHQVRATAFCVLPSESSECAAEVAAPTTSDPTLHRAQ